MHKDLKIGLVLGLILVIFVTLRLATEPSLSPQARLQRLQNAASESESPNQSTPAETQEIDSQKTDSEQINISAGTESITETKIQNIMQDTNENERLHKIKSQRFHIVQKGETLSGIAYKYYGSAAKWPKILEANKDLIEDANKLKPGTKIIIPE